MNEEVWILTIVGRCILYVLFYNWNKIGLS